MNYIVLFTNQKHSKNKKWKDGYGIYHEDTHKFELYEEINNKKQIVFTDVINHRPLVGEIIDVHNYLVDFDSVYSKVSSSSSSNGCSPSKQNVHQKVSICGGLKKRKVLQPSIKPLLTLNANNTFINNNNNHCNNNVNVLNDNNNNNNNDNNKNNKNQLNKSNEMKDNTLNQNDIDEILQLFEMEEEEEQKEPIQQKEMINEIKQIESKQIKIKQNEIQEFNEQKQEQKETKKKKTNLLQIISKHQQNETNQNEQQINEESKQQKQEQKEINQNKALQRKNKPKPKRLLFQLPKALQTIKFPVNLIESEKELERFRTLKDSCQPQYTNIHNYITDMNNIIVNEMNFHFAELAHQFYTEVDTQAITMGAEGRITICEHGVATRLTCKKDGPNKHKVFYVCPKRQCKAFQWEETLIKQQKENKIQKIDMKRLRYDLPEALNKKIDLKLLNTKKFEQQGMILFLDVEVFESKKLMFSNDDQMDENEQSDKKDRLKDSFKDEKNYIKSYFMKINDYHKVKGIKKDDLWILLPSSYPYTLSTQFHVVTSLYHSPTKDGLIQIEFVTQKPIPFKKMNCIALKAHCASTELLMLQSLVQLSMTQQHLLSPLMKYLIFHQYTPIPNQRFPNIDLIKQFRLNKEQTIVIEQVIHSLLQDRPPLTLVHGVFGAGKSHLLSVLSILLSSLNYRVLICASTNVAVDRVLESLLSKNYVSFCRVGSIKKISKHILPYTITESDGMNDLRELKKDISLTSIEKKIIEKEINERKSGKIAQRRNQMKDVSIVGVTCASSTNPLLGDHYDIILLDEATQSIEPLMLIPILRFNPKCIVCVGDPMQLDPVLQAEHHSATLFQRMNQIESSIMLKTQYRCCPAISEIVNRLYYHDQLENGLNVYDQKSLIPMSYEIVILYHEIDDEQVVGSSYSSQFEISVINETVQQLKDLNVNMETIGIMSFYKQQCEEIALNMKVKDVTVNTIDAFQGAERDIIILSFVRNKESSFLENAKRLNVALTRARNNLIFVMHRNILQHEFIQNLLKNVRVSYMDCELFLKQKRFVFESD